MAGFMEYLLTAGRATNCVVLFLLRLPGGVAVARACATAPSVTLPPLNAPALGKD